MDVVAIHIYSVVGLLTIKLLSLWVKKNLKSVNIGQNYKQGRDCFVHFACLSNTLLKDEESARDNHVLA